MGANQGGDDGLVGGFVFVFNVEKEVCDIFRRRYRGIDLDIIYIYLVYCVF